jgi:TolB-like protein/DNA-binding winged helix-turn-helix (wHTH) protein
VVKGHLIDLWRHKGEYRPGWLGLGGLAEDTYRSFALRRMQTRGENWALTARVHLCMEPTSTIFRFGDYESRSRTRELYVRGSKLKIRPQPLRVLNLLLSRAGDVVTREELRRELWSSEIFVDFEHVLNTSIKEIRAVLSDSATEPRYVETLPKLGYRFIAPVEKIEPMSDAATQAAATPSGAAENPTAAADGQRATATSLPPTSADDHAAAEAATTAPGPARPNARYALAAILLAVLLAGGLMAAYRWTHAPAKRTTTAASRAMIAVLPFKNLTGDASQEYFSDGLTEEMIAQLGHIDPQHLGVIAGTSVMHYQNSAAPLEQIARELGVQYVLEGSVRREADKVRITAQLIQLSDQTHLFAREYDRQLDSVLSVQAEIAREISDEIQSALGQRGAGAQQAVVAVPVAPKSYEAYDDYLKGRYFWNKRTPAGFEAAAEYFQQSIAKDPAYARAYAGLADTYALMAEYYVAPPAEVIPKARAAALKASNRDDQLAEAHASLALIAQNYDWDWPTAEKEFRRAIELDPNYATGHHWYAEHLAFEGRFDEAFAEMNRALQLDPLSLIMKADQGMFLYYSRQYDRAIVQMHEVLEMDPTFSRGHMIVFSYLETGRLDDALAEIGSWKHAHLGFWIPSLEVQVYTRTNHPEEARRAMEELKESARKQDIDPVAFVGAYIAEKDYEGAFASLDAAVARHSPTLTSLKVDPVYDPIRSDPRFQALLRRVGLAQ